VRDEIEAQLAEYLANKADSQPLDRVEFAVANSSHN
jgi:hypothetical protein